MKYEFIKDDITIKEFVGELNALCWRYGYKSQAALGEALGVSQVTAGKYLRDPSNMTFFILRKMVKILKPNPTLVLRALGYTSKDIERYLDMTVLGKRNTPGNRSAD